VWSTILVFVATLLATGVHAQTYPSGAFASLSFNHSLEDTAGHTVFFDAQFVDFDKPVESWKGLWTADRNGKENGAIVTLPEDGVMQFYPQFQISNIPESNNYTFVITFKIEDLHKEHYIVSGSREIRIKLEKENLVTRVIKEKGSDREETHLIALDIKEDEWTTLAIATDIEKSTITYYANGKKYELTDPVLGMSSNRELQRGHLGESVYIDNPNGEVDKDDVSYVTIDEIRFYTRELSQAELTALCDGTKGENPFVVLEKTIQKPTIRMNWTWAAIQIAFALLCLLYLNKPKKKLAEVSAADFEGRTTNPESADELLDKAYSYWGGVNPNNESKLPFQYPNSKNGYKDSANAFKEAIDAGNTDQSFIEKANLFVRTWNSAQLRNFKGVWWVFLVAVVAVYCRGLLDSYGFFGIGDGSSYDGLPEGFWKVVIYLSKYSLPGVLISGIAYGAASFIPRYRTLAGEEVDPKHINDTYDTKKMLIIAGGAIAASLLSVVFGVVGFLAVIAVAGFAFLRYFNFDSLSMTEVTKYSSGRVEKKEVMNPAGLMMFFGIIIGAIFVAYFASVIIIFLFNILFIVQALINYVIKP
jgi:hypothetical protein